MNSFESHSTNWSEFAKNKGALLLIYSFASRAVQAAPSVIPSTSTILHPGVIRFNSVSRLYFSRCFVVQYK